MQKNESINYSIANIDNKDDIFWLTVSSLEGYIETYFPNLKKSILGSPEYVEFSHVPDQYKFEQGDKIFNYKNYNFYLGWIRYKYWILNSEYHLEIIIRNVDNGHNSIAFIYNCSKHNFISKTQNGISYELAEVLSELISIVDPVSEYTMPESFIDEYEVLESVNYSVAGIENNFNGDKIEDVIERVIDFTQENFPEMTVTEKKRTVGPGIFYLIQFPESLWKDKQIDECIPVFMELSYGEVFLDFIECATDTNIIYVVFRYNNYRNKGYTLCYNLKKSVWVNGYSISIENTIIDKNLAIFLADLTYVIQPSTQCCNYNWFMRKDIRESIDYSVAGIENDFNEDKIEDVIERVIDFAQENFPEMTIIETQRTVESDISYMIQFPEDLWKYRQIDECIPVFMELRYGKVFLEFIECVTNTDTIYVVFSSINHRDNSYTLSYDLKKSVWINGYGLSIENTIIDKNLAIFLANLTYVIQPGTQCCNYNWFMRKDIRESINYSISGIDKEAIEENPEIVTERFIDFIQENFPETELEKSSDGIYTIQFPDTLYPDYIPDYMIPVFNIENTDYFLQYFQVVRGEKFSIMLNEIGDPIDRYVTFSYDIPLHGWRGRRVLEYIKVREMLTDRSLAELLCDITKVIDPGTPCCDIDWYIDPSLEENKIDDIILESFTDDIIDIVDTSDEIDYSSYDDPNEMPRLSLVFDDLTRYPTVRANYYKIPDILDAIPKVERLEMVSNLDSVHFGINIKRKIEGTHPRMKGTYYDKIIWLDELKDTVEKIKVLQKNDKDIDVSGFQLAFRYLTSKKDDVRYCFKVLTLAIKTLYNMSRLFGALRPNTMIELLLGKDIDMIPDKDGIYHYVDNGNNEIFYLRNFSALMNGVMHGDSFAKFMNQFFKPRIPFTAEEINEIINKNYANIGTNGLLKALHNSGPDMKNLYKFHYKVDKKTLVIELPERVTSTLEGLNIKHLLSDLKLRNCILRIDGTLEITDLDEYSNLSYLDTNYSHNRLNIETGLDPKLLKGILSKASFKTLDLSKADFSTEMFVNMNSDWIKNHNCDIIASKDKLEIVK